jgi:hypothetical protein
VRLESTLSSATPWASTIPLAEPSIPEKTGMS